VTLVRASKLRSDWRWPGAALLVEIAAIHVSLVPQHLREAPYAGVLFAALGAGALVTAAALLICDDRRVWLSAALLVGGAIAGYIASRSIGLPSLADDVGDWLNPLGGAAVLAEVLTLVLSAAVLTGARSGRDQASARARPAAPLATGRA
jgi:hypothetical protein